MWQTRCPPSNCIPSWKVLSSQIHCELRLNRDLLFTNPKQAWPLIPGEYFNHFSAKKMDWIKNFSQDRKLKCWENYETVLSLRLLFSFANHQHSVVSQRCSSHNWLTRIWDFLEPDVHWKKSQWDRSVLQVTYRKQGMQSLKNFYWKCDCFNKI